MGKADGTFDSLLPFGGYLPGAVFLASGDFDGDGRQDVAIAATGGNYQAGGGVVVAMGRGDGTFDPSQIASYGGVPYALVAADLDGDGRDELAVANSSSRNVVVWKRDPNGLFRPVSSVSLGSAFPYWIAAGRLDDDANLDLAGTEPSRPP